MSDRSINLDLLLEGNSHSLLERTLCAEYLLANGYLPSDLEELPPQVVKNLMGKAYQVAARRLSALGFIERFQFSLPFSPN